MKLSAAILIASVAAQTGQGRQRENKNTDAFDLGFGSYDDFFSTDFNNAAGFDDSSFGDFNYDSFFNFDSDAAATTAAPKRTQAASKGKPVKKRPAASKGTGKTNFMENDQTRVDHTVGVIPEKIGCYLASENSKENWLTNGRWGTCPGELDVCELKVVRRNHQITQIHSKCANRHSCTDNMRQNFSPRAENPAGLVTSHSVYSTWMRQQCRPRLEVVLGTSHPSWKIFELRTRNMRSRHMGDSVCFNCLVSCRNKQVLINNVTSADEMQNSGCVGRSNMIDNVFPIKGNSNVEFFTEFGEGLDHPLPGTNMTMGQNYYSTLLAVIQRTELSGNGRTMNNITLTEEISYVQQQQIWKNEYTDIGFLNNGTNPNNGSHIADAVDYQLDWQP